MGHLTGAANIESLYSIDRLSPLKGGIVMQINQLIKCGTFPCADVNHASYTLPGIEINPEDVSVILISESAPADTADYYYAPGNPLNFLWEIFLLRQNSPCGHI